jgi:long-chain acyl-CoA synthetase
VLDRLIALNQLLTRNQANVPLSRKLLAQVHKAFGGELLAMFTGGAFIDPPTLQFFYDLGIPVANGYGLTEAGTVLTVNDLKPFRADTVGKPLPGVELRILNPDDEGIGEVAAKSKTIMSHYLDDPELTAGTIVDGWLRTGDLGRLDDSGHLQLFGRKKNMIVTEGGKNIYPEDIEAAFDGVALKEYCVFAVNFIWPKKELGGETLVLVLHPDLNQEFTDAIKQDLASRNRNLPDFKRIAGYVLWDKDFPRTASMKIKRDDLAQEIRNSLDRSTVKEL